MASVSFNDILELMRLVVQSSTETHAALDGKTLNEYIEGRVVGPHLLDADSGSFKRPCIVLDLFSGSEEYSFALQASTVYVYAYDDQSMAQATDMYEAFNKVMQGTRLFDPSGNNPFAGYGHETSRPISGPNERLKTWFARGVWIVRLAG